MDIEMAELDILTDHSLMWYQTRRLVFEYTTQYNQRQKQRDTIVSLDEVAQSMHYSGECGARDQTLN